MTTEPRWLLPLLVVAGAAISFFLGLGAVPLFDLDEGAFSEATREMLERGDYISTFLNGQPRYDKPVLIYWFQAASVSLLGLNEFALRLPSALFACGWVLTVFLFVQRQRGRQPALVAAGMTATAAGITVIGRAAIADALLNLLVAVACTSAFLYLMERERRWLHAAFLAMGFGLLAKGPVAVLVPLATTFLYCASRGDLRTWWRAVTDLRGIGLMLAIALPWYAAQYWKEGDAFVQGFLFKHNVARFSAPMHGFDGSVLFYVPWLAAATLPFLGPLLNAMRRVRAIWQDDLERYCAIWFGFVFVFFSVSGTKLPHYIFYGFTGLFIAMALQLPAVRRPWTMLLPVVLVLGAMAALPFGLDRLAPGLRDPYYREALADVRSQFGMSYYVTCGVLAAAAAALLATRRLGVGTRLVAGGCGVAAMIAMFILPVAGRVQQAPVKEAAAIAKARGLQVVMWGLDTPSFLVYTERLAEKRAPRAGEVALTKVKRLPELPAYDVLFQRNGIALVRVRAAP